MRENTENMNECGSRKVGWKERAGRENGGEEEVIDYKCPVLKVSGAFPLIYWMERAAVSMGSLNSDDGACSPDSL